jgi:tungstate transport system substrate-binding protein
VVALAGGGCASGAGTSEVILASTTSVHDSGLLDVLLPAFQQARPQVRVKLIAVGTGQALALGRRGDADVLLVHAPDAEAEFMAEGAGRSRTPFMRNDFVIVGPVEDPAGVAQATSAASAMRAIARTRSSFVSRGDDSGTHQRELTLWQEVGLTEADAAQVSDAGQGMAETLMIASERAAYTLTDRATFLMLASGLALTILHAGDPSLVNTYSVITVANSPDPQAADTFADWIATDAAATLIGSFGSDRSSRPVFEPLPRDSLP